MEYSDYMSYADYNGYGFLGAMAAVGVFLIVVMILVAIALYILFAIGLMKMAQNKGIANAWLAWIPIAQLYIMGKIIGSFKIFDWEIAKAELWLPVGAAASIVLWYIPLVKLFVPGALFIATAFAFYKLFSVYRAEKATLYTLSHHAYWRYGTDSCFRYQK